MAIDKLRNDNSEKSSQFRKANKPLMEKLRRARINESLNELKLLILESLHKDVSQYSKMEKADILEMAVKHLKCMREETKKRESLPKESSSLVSYKTGYSECVQEVTRHVMSADGIDARQKESLFSYLSTRQSAVANLPPVLPQLPISFTPAPTSFAQSPVPQAYSPQSGTLPPFVTSPVLSSYPSPPASPVNMCRQTVMYSPIYVAKPPVSTSTQHKTPASSPSFPADAPLVWRPW